jgi:hypothetical protein
LPKITVPLLSRFPWLYSPPPGVGGRKYLRRN